MPIPNVSDEDTLLIECSCHGSHYLQVAYFGDDERAPLILGLIGTPPTLIGLIRDWWRSRQCWFHEVVLETKDVDVLIERLQKLRSKIN